MTQVQRPWGTYEDLLTEREYKVKKIIVEPKKRLSLQSHSHRDETWCVVKGTGLFTIMDQFLLVDKSSGPLYIAKNQKHRVENIGDTDLIIIETQRGDLLSEDDIIRFEDDFGRAPKKSN